MSTITIEPNQEIIDRLLRLHQADRLAHGYLFTGAKYTGKFETALAMANELSDSIDTHTLECDYGEKIKIDEVRSILQLMGLRPFSAEKKVIIIRNVELMTVESSNILLKTLEEPTASSLMILTTSAVERVLPTIRSRCHRVHFATPSKEVLAEQLRNLYHEDTLSAHFLSTLAEGSLGVAQNYQARGLFERKNQWITQFVFGPPDPDFAKKELKDLKDKALTKEFLDVLLSWMRDAALVYSGVADDHLIHLDRRDELEQFARRYHFENLADIYDEVISAQKMLADNLNLKLPLLIIKEKMSWAS